MTPVTDEELVDHFDLERMQRNLEVAEDAPLSEVISDQLWVNLRIALAKVRLLTKERDEAQANNYKWNETCQALREQTSRAIEQTKEAVAQTKRSMELVRRSEDVIAELRERLGLR